MSDDPRLRSRSLLLLRDEDPRARQIALLAALLLHVLFISVTLPSLREVRPPEPPPRRPVCVRRLPPVPPPPARRPSPPILEEPRARRLPVPDPEPEAPEPVREPIRPLEPAGVPVGEVEVILPAGHPPPARAPLIPGVGGVSYPRLIESTRVMPRYPGAARSARVQGRVILRAVVRSDGGVGEIEVLRTPGRDLGFEEEAIRAVRRWRYHPGEQNGRPVDVTFTVVVDFVLE